MKAKLKNLTGGYIVVDMDITDTPLQVIKKAIDNNSASDVSVIFNSPKDLDAFKGDPSTLDKAMSAFNLETKKGLLVLQWDLPIAEQAKAEIGDISNSGRDVTFVVTISLIVG